MRRLITLTIAMLALSSFMAARPLVQNPHFIFCSASGPNCPTDPDSLNASLNVSFQIAGLGPNQTITITASGETSGFYGCVTPQGGVCISKNSFPPDPVTALGTFRSSGNGQITGMLTLVPTVTLNCGGAEAVVFNITYRNVKVKAAPAGECNIPGTFSANCCPYCWPCP